MLTLLILVGVFGLPLIIVLALIMHAGAKANMKKVRREMDLVLSRQRATDSHINRLIDDIEQAGKIVGSLSEGDKVRIEKLREIREKKQEYKT